MMTGIITADREAALSVTIRGPSGQEMEVQAVIDALSLPYHSRSIAMLGDGSRVVLREYEAVVVWDGRARDVLVLEPI
jgi:predicted aspartyl protease